jgi:hypothetical protein
LLGVSVHTDASPHDPPPMRMPFGSVGRLDHPREMLGEWTQRCQELRNAIWIWEQLREAGIGDELRGRLSPQRNRGKVEAWSFAQSLPEHTASKEPNILSHLIRPGEDVTFLERDYRTPTVMLLNEMVNYGMRDRVKYRQEVDLKSRRPVARLLPVGLLGAAWLRLSRAVTGGREIRVCRMCPRMFVVGDGRERKRVTCQPSCKLKMHRRNPKPSTRKGTKK